MNRRLALTATRPGMTMLELLLAMTIFGVILVASMGFFQYQGRAFNDGNELMTLQQNLRYGVSTLEQHLHAAGIGVPASQPALIYAGTATVAFNADYNTRDPEDLFAVYYDDGLPDAAANALDYARRFTLPGTSFTYPDTSYGVGGGNSPAETIIFFFADDTSTTREDDYVLYRQLNDQDPEIITRNLLNTGSEPFFEYLEATTDSVTGDSVIKTISTATLPLRHTAATHNSVADTGSAARIDRVRGVRVRYTSTNGETGDDEQTRNISRLIRLPNAAFTIQRICGNVPILGDVNFQANRTTGDDGQVYVELSWDPATDESSGEQDVIRYLVWRRASPTVAWGDPLVSVPGGSASYTYEDHDVVSEMGITYYYALAAQDCTPNESATMTTSEYVP